MTALSYWKKMSFSGDVRAAPAPTPAPAAAPAPGSAELDTLGDVGMGVSVGDVGRATGTSPCDEPAVPDVPGVTVTPGPTIGGPAVVTSGRLAQPQNPN